MKNLLKFLILLYLFFITPSLFAIEFTPKVSHKMKLCYYEGGPWETYPHNLIATVKGLMDIGWIEPFPMPDPENVSTEQLWQYFVESLNKRSNSLEFVGNCYWSSRWNVEIRKTNKQKIIHRLNRKEIDLVLAMGTWAGQDLANLEHQVPTVVMSTSDPLAAGIIHNVEDSGFDHLHARVDPFKYERQINVFYTAVKFKKLGLPYENTSSGKSYAAYDIVHKMAKRLDFKIIECHLHTTDSVQSELKDARMCLEHFIAEGVDAVYVTAHNGLQLKHVKVLMPFLNSHRIYTFAQEGSKYVKQGVLMSMYTGQYGEKGRFYAQTIARILNGAKPRLLPQVFEDLERISLNVKTAIQVNFEFTEENLLMVDEFYGVTE